MRRRKSSFQDYPSEKRSAPSGWFSSLDREILFLAVPATGSSLTLVVHTWVDTWWVSRLENPDVPLAALSIAAFTVWIFGSVTALLGMGLTALIARYVGSRRLDAARYVAYQGILGAVGLGFVTAVVGWFLAPSVFSLVSDDADVNHAGIGYVRIFWGGGFALLVQRACDATFRAHGNTRTPFLISLGSMVLNVVLDPLLMFGMAGLPALGVHGVALATVATAGIAGALTLYLLHRTRWISAHRPTDEELRLTEATQLGRPGVLGLDWTLLRRVARIGLPVAYSGILFSVVYLLISRAVGDAGGTAAQAALGLGHRGEAIAYMLASGFAVAAASIVGRRLGAGRPEDAARAAWRTVVLCGIACALWSCFLLFGGEMLAAFFVEPGPTRQYATSYYRVTALCLIPQAADIVLEGAFGGAGMTLPPMLITIPISLLRIPLAYWAVAAGYGVEGIWWVISLTAILRGVVMVLWFRRGTWKSQSV